MSHRGAKKVGGASSSLVREQDAPATIAPAPKSTLKPKLHFLEFRDAQRGKVFLTEHYLTRPV